VQPPTSPAPASRPTPPAPGAGGPVLFETIRTVRTFETAIEHIVEGLERARLRRGDRLPNEAQLANQLGISKPTLRQALLVLERAGLLDVRLGKTGGVFVASDLVPDDAISTAVALEERAVVDVLQGRRVIETAVVHYATAVADAGDYAELERSIELVRAHLGDRTAVMAADAMFHRVLVRACRNETMRAAMRVLERRIAPVRDSYSGGLYWDKHVVDVHSRQVAAMRARDLAALEPVLEAHFRMLEDAYCAALAKDWRQLFGRGVQPAA
jgi:GntR family transcriptional regulator, transcriptional repressor for pyruvate dehydrogenase complex